MVAVFLARAHLDVRSCELSEVVVLGALSLVLRKRLAGRDYVAGDYSIADMAIFRWCRLHERQGQRIEDFPNVKRWFARVAARPAVAKDMARLEDMAGEFTEESWSNLFGAEQYKRR